MLLKPAFTEKAFAHFTQSNSICSFYSLIKMMFTCDAQSTEPAFNHDT